MLVAVLWYGDRLGYPLTKKQTQATQIHHRKQLWSAGCFVSSFDFKITRQTLRNLDVNKNYFQKNHLSMLSLRQFYKNLKIKYIRATDGEEKRKSWRLQ